MKNTDLLSSWNNLTLDQFQYDLPASSIAQEPLAERSASKLLFYRKGEITHHSFKEITDLLPPGQQLFFNDTRVIPARLQFYKSTGALIEIFLLNPEAPHKDINMAMQVTGSCQWTTMIGNLKKWKDGQTLQSIFNWEGKQIIIKATLEDRQSMLVKFTWTPSDVNFITCISGLGQTPLPPYIHREAKESDATRYQTVYSNIEGAVAAPTAGLHFNDAILETLQKKGHGLNYLTLHVGAGTFQPIKEKEVIRHDMHGEQIMVDRKMLSSLLQHEGNIIAVGTTSMRTLESCYWLGVEVIINGKPSDNIHKMAPYRLKKEEQPSAKKAISALQSYMEQQNIEKFTTSTSIMIVPGYDFKICNGLITNFHMPGSTLMLLVAAFVGEDWKEIYQQAKDKNYRFLSYGDSSLLLPNK